MALIQATRIATLNTPLGGDTLVFQSLSISEELGRLFSLDIAAASERGDLKADDLLGKGVSVELQCPRGGVRYFHGFVSRFSRIPRPGTRYFAYHLSAVPWLWFLTRQSDCRIFQNKTLQDIMRDVFDRGGFSDFKFQLSGNYTPWEYCVQYRETDFNFVSRLMEQEGVYYYFEHEKDKHTAVFADSPAAHQPFPKYEKLTFSALTTIHERDQEHIYDWVAEGRHHSGKHQYTDYDFTRPNTDLKTPESNPGRFAHSDFEIYDYPGEYDKRSDGEQWSRVRMEELRADRETFQGGGDVTGLATGRKFTLSEGPHPVDVGDYVVIASSIDLQSNVYESGSTGEMGESYHCTFTAIKAADQFRPARLTPKPMIHGLQTAVVTGPKGEEIYTDKYGRIKVQFFWDREGKADENTTCFIRVAQFWAGRKWGAMFLPRIGQEVVVSFLEGDPDQPLVIGSVYNGEQMPFYPLPDHKTKSTIKSNSSKGGEGFNEIRFEDKKNGEQVFIHSEKRMDVRVKASVFETNGGNRDINIGAKTDKYPGGNLSITVGADENVHINGALYERVERKLNQTVVGDVIEDYEANLSTMVKSKVELNAREIIVEAAQRISLKVGGNFILIDPSGVTIYGMMVKINSGGFGVETGDPGIDDPLDAETADTGEPGYLERPRSAGVGGHRHRTLHSQHAPSLPRPGEDARMTAIRNRLSTIPAGRHALEVFDQNQTTASFTPGIGGFFDPATNNMNLDPTWGDFNNTAFVHEMNHDQSSHEGTSADINTANRADYVDGELREEAHGDALANQAADELAASGNPQTTPPPNQAEYHTGYQEGVDAARRANPNATPEELDAAGRQSGEQRVLDNYRSGRVTTSNTNQPYPDYYGNAWDAAHPHP
jgi:type VI secretion system Vgr family protein